MSNGARAGVVALAVAVVVIAFVALRPGDSSKKQDDPATPASNTTAADTNTQDSDVAEQPTATAPAAPPPPEQITLKDGTVVGGVKRIQVEKGDQVRLQVRTDEPASDSIHLHGYDIEKDAVKGKPANFTFKADVEGVFEIESHTAEDAGRDPLLGRLVVEPLMLVIAHGIVGRSDLPIPEWLFGWAAAVVLVVSFVALAILWPSPRLQDGGFRPLPDALSRVLSSRVVEVVCGAVGVALLVLVIHSGLNGVQVATANFAPNFVLVLFWVGMVPLSVLFGDVFRVFNPWRAIGRVVAGVGQAAARGPLPAPLAYPERAGYVPAAVGLFAFTALELVDPSNGSKPSNVAIATLIYSAVTFVAMALYGVDNWCRRGEAFSVYYNLFSRIGPWTRRGAQIGLRKPLSGLAELEPERGMVLLLAVMIGTVTFDGAAEAPLWTGIVPHLNDAFAALGFGPQNALRITFLIGLVASVALIYGFYMLGIYGARSVGGGFGQRQLARVFVHTLVPIALAYVAAHYLTYLLYQGQSLKFLASNPLGRDGVDYFGTANDAIDYGVIGATAAWYYQVAFVVVGHVAALVLAHDRALVSYDKPRLAVRSQYWMLVVMVGFTSLALWLLAQSNG